MLCFLREIKFAQDPNSYYGFIMTLSIDAGKVCGNEWYENFPNHEKRCELLGCLQPSSSPFAEMELCFVIQLGKRGCRTNKSMGLASGAAAT